MSANVVDNNNSADDGNLFIGVDVGTGSVRAALVTASGSIVASKTQDTTTFRSDTDHRIFEQSTTDIWNAICTCIKGVIASAAVDPARVKALGFDATCSLAVTDLDGAPVSVSNAEDIGNIGQRNIILWADHRAEEEAKLINNSDSVVLDYVGGVMSVSRLVFLWIFLYTAFRDAL